MGGEGSDSDGEGETQAYLKKTLLLTDSRVKERCLQIRRGEDVRKEGKNKIYLLQSRQVKG